jgi:hypothetical protein
MGNEQASKRRTYEGMLFDEHEPGKREKPLKHKGFS